MLPPSTLLTTKLYRPPAAANEVARPALFARLHEGLSHKLILLSAPPGFGKTTLVSQWLAGCGRPSAWLSLDEGDNDFIQFLRYLIAAVHTCVPNACPTTQSLLTATNLPGVDYLADVLVSELTTLTEPLILVLDDYHAIRSSEVHQIMRHLLRYRPPALHPVILTRTDPPLHLGRLRMTQQITEIRAGDLRFGLAETRQYLQMHGDQPLDEAIVRALQTRTEGWVIGLQLACLSMQNQAPQEFVARFGGGNRLLIGYLVEEVIAGLPKPVAEFLIRTALLDRFCAPLADALLADSLWPGTSQATIAQLEADNLFVILLDDEGEWYRYHDLFRDFLLHRLRHERSPEAVTHLHKCASAWLAEAGLIEDALRHSLAAGDESAAAELFITHFHAMLDQQIPAPTLTRWLAFFPDATSQVQPGLLLAQVWLKAFNSAASVPVTQLAEIETLIQSDPSLSAGRRKMYWADLNLVRGVFAYRSGEPHRAIALLQDALKQQALTHVLARVQALIHLAAAHACTGAPAVAHMLLRTELAEAVAQQSPTMVVLFGALAIIHLLAGELAEASLTARQAVAAMDEHAGRSVWQGIGFAELWYAWAHYLLGVVYYEQNDLAAATRHWQQVETMRYRTNPGVFHDSLLGLALVAHIRGNASAALAYAQAAREFAEELHNASLLTLSTAIEVRLALLGGNAADALRRSQGIDTTRNEGVHIGMETPRLARLSALIADATPASLTTAQQLAETCLRQAEEAHNTRQVIQILAVQALGQHALQQHQEATRALARALLLGEPGGFLRTFLDLGAPMAALLRTYRVPDDQARYVNRLLVAFETDNLAQRRDLTAHYTRLHGITPLTPRELEVLALVAKRLSLAEIAATLVISISTVKNHTHQIYTKLGVRNGRQAVAKAQELDLLLPA